MDKKVETVRTMTNRIYRQRRKHAREALKVGFVKVEDDLGSLSFPYFHAKKWWMHRTDYGYLLSDDEESEIYVAKTYGQGGTCAWLVVWTAPDLTQEVRHGECQDDKESVEAALTQAFSEITINWRA